MFQLITPVNGWTSCTCQMNGYDKLTLIHPFSFSIVKLEPPTVLIHSTNQVKVAVTNLSPYFLVMIRIFFIDWYEQGSHSLKTV